MYKHSVGGWRQYAEHVQPIITEFRKYLPYLKKKKMLPFADKINWNMDVDFPYDREEPAPAAGSTGATKPKLASGPFGSSGKKNHQAGQSAPFTVRRDL